MSSEAVVAIIAAITTLLGATGGFMAKSRFGDVMASPSSREETAVQRMASLLDRLADFQNVRESRLFDLQDKALETVATMTGVVKEVAVTVQILDTRSRQDHQAMADDHSMLLSSLDQINQQLISLEKLIADLALELIAERRAIQAEKSKG